MNRDIERAMDPKKSPEYQQGYHEGYREGYSKAFEMFKNELETIHTRKSISIKCQPVNGECPMLKKEAPNEPQGD